MTALRKVPLSARLLMLSEHMVIPVLFIAFWLPTLGYWVAGGADVLWFRDSIDLPARIVPVRATSKSRGKNVPAGEGYRVEAEFAHQGRTWRATGDLSGGPLEVTVATREGAVASRRSRGAYSSRGCGSSRCFSR